MTRDSCHHSSERCLYHPSLIRSDGNRRKRPNFSNLLIFFESASLRTLLQHTCKKKMVTWELMQPILLLVPKLDFGWSECEVTQKLQ